MAEKVEVNKSGSTYNLLNVEPSKKAGIFSKIYKKIS